MTEITQSRGTALRIGLASTLKMIPYICSKGGPAYVLHACMKAISITGNLHAHMQLLQVITRPHVIDLAKRHPRLAYRYLNPYLALSFGRRTRLRVLAGHYAYLQDRVSRDFLYRVYIESPAVWQECLDGHQIEIQLCFPKEHDCEGDLRLDFVSDSVQIYTITFTITPGSLVQADVPHVLLVTAIQGASRKFDLIRTATKICDDTSPPHLLLAAAQGVAHALGIGAIAGISTEQQISRGYSAERGFFFKYDEFWQSLIGECEKKNFYTVPVPPREKPIKQVRANHRTRTLRRRALRSKIAERTTSYLKEHFILPSALI